AVNKAHGRPENQEFDCHFEFFNDQCSFSLDFSSEFDYVQASVSFSMRFARNFNETHESSSAYLNDYIAAALPHKPNYDLVATGDRELELRVHQQPDDRQRDSMRIEISYYNADLPSDQRAVSSQSIHVNALDAMLSKNQGDEYVHVETIEGLDYPANIVFEVTNVDTREQRSSVTSKSTHVKSRPPVFVFVLGVFEPDTRGIHKFVLSWSDQLRTEEDAAATEMKLQSKRIIDSSSQSGTTMTEDLPRFNPLINATEVYPSETTHLELGYEYQLTLVATNNYGTRSATNTEVIKLGYDPLTVQNLTFVIEDIGSNTHANVLITWEAPADTGAGVRPIDHYVVTIGKNNETKWHMQVQDYYEIENVEYDTNFTVSVSAVNALEMQSEPAEIYVHTTKPQERLSAPVFNSPAIVVSSANTVDVSWRHATPAQAYIVEVIYNDTAIDKQSHYHKVSSDTLSGVSLQYTFTDLTEGLVQVAIAAVRFNVEGNWTLSEQFYCMGKPQLPFQLSAILLPFNSVFGSVLIEMSWNYKQMDWPQVTQLALKRTEPKSGAEEQLATYTLQNKVSHSVSGMYDTAFHYYVRARLQNPVSSSAWTDWVRASDQLVAKQTAEPVKHNPLPAYVIVQFVFVPLLLLGLGVAFYRRYRTLQLTDTDKVTQATERAMEGAGDVSVSLENEVLEAVVFEEDYELEL
ncbi:MAG: hypothetical protein MHM6MM_008168, partial [Cercozoa sp. M6MM]